MIAAVQWSAFRAGDAGETRAAAWGRSQRALWRCVGPPRTSGPQRLSPDSQPTTPTARSGARAVHCVFDDELRVLFLQQRFELRITECVEIGKLTARSIHCINCMDAAHIGNCFT